MGFGLRVWGVGVYGLRFRGSNFGLTWRFMGSYKWGYKSPITIVILLITLLITTHEPPSRVCDVGFGAFGFRAVWPRSYRLVSRARSKSLN